MKELLYKKIIEDKRGYTIVELLAVVSILIVVSGVIIGILFSTLRGSSKTKVTTNVSQNGNFALSVISDMIVDSGSVTQIGGIDITDCTASPSGDSLTLRRLDGTLTTLSCASNTISSNSASLINTNQVMIEDNTCFFYCNQASTDPYSIPIVGVTFKLTDKNTGLSETKGSGDFETSVSLRNYSP